MKHQSLEASEFKKGSLNRQLTVKERQAKRCKSKTRARVGKFFGVIKNQFGFKKVRYRGLDKNTNVVFITCALVNFSMARMRLLIT